MKDMIDGAIRMGKIRSPLKQILLGIVDALHALGIQVQELQALAGIELQEGKDE